LQTTFGRLLQSLRSGTIPVFPGIDKRKRDLSELRPFFSTFFQTEALTKLFISKGIITQQELLQKIAAERPTY